MQNFLKFPDTFIWGAATSAYQIEGSCTADGRGASIWDMFARRPGAILANQNGDVACDHYRLYKQDVALMQNLGLKAYRFSIAWSRIFPSGSGPINRAGLDFYERLVDTLLEHGIEPFITLYHWDLPQKLEDRGGWRNRDTARYFADYAAAVADVLALRARSWITINEMPCIAYEGYRNANHAPGAKEDARTVNQVIHHLLLAHGWAMQALRGHAQLKAGIVHNPAIFIPQTADPKDWQAAQAAYSLENVSWCGYNDWWLDPIFKGSYPQQIVQQKMQDQEMPLIQPDDFKIISTPMDFLGLNIYSGSLVRFDQNTGYALVPYPRDYPHTNMPWPIAPQSVYYGLKTLAQKYKIPQFFITENGATFEDVLQNDTVHDAARQKFLQDYLVQAHRAVQDGLPLAGYFAWSLMDNFEWAMGYSKRFGLLYTDYPTQRRIFKSSAHWYRNVISQNGFVPSAV